jgi:hypothetical protein
VNPGADPVAVAPMAAKPHAQPVTVCFRDIRQHYGTFIQPPDHDVDLPALVQVTECRSAVQGSLTRGGVLESPVATVPENGFVAKFLDKAIRARGGCLGFDSGFK